MNYYNEHDTKAAAWLRELIKTGLIPNGDVDERSITELQPDELRQYTQCHFFAGIGGWSYALQLAGWPADKPVWTGSCPCQPFSSAGKGLAQADERHLWPVFFDLIKECRPDAVFGEQVASAIGKGWLDGVSSDLESEGYACGSVVLGAHSVRSPHIRQRLYWVADSNNNDRQRGTYAREMGYTSSGIKSSRNKFRETISDSCNDGGLADSELCRRERIKVEQCTGILKTMDGKEEPQFAISPHSASFRRLADADGSDQQSTSARIIEHGLSARSRDGVRTQGVEELAQGFWDDSQLVYCRDGKTRRIPTEPAFFPLAHGVSARVVRLRGYGNAIVPQVASEFVKAYSLTI